MALVKHVLQRKGRSVRSLGPESTVQDALRELDRHNIGALLILDGDQLVGIFSERDFARIVARTGQMDLNAPIRQVMTRQVFFAEPEHSVEECMKLMTSKHIRHLPVMEGGKVAGVISINDLVREIIADHQTTIKSLENFLIGQTSIG